jgi:hypothetical protein
MEDWRTAHDDDDDGDEDEVEYAVAEIVDQLKRYDINDPRPLRGRAVPLDDYVAAEVRRSYERVRIVPPGGAVPPAAKLRHFGKFALKYGMGIPAGLAMLWSRYKPEPPPGADAFKYRCADEAFFLVETFTQKMPTGAVDGPFCTIARYLYDSNADGHPLKRACEWVLGQRRKFPRNEPSA